jgi:TolB-like protein/DNA-binding SARP family transcriptional activator/Tfp pilus assembly protein PilF
MVGLRIALLGGLEIMGGEITAQASLTRKPRALIAYLALQGERGQSREKLTELLWGNSAEEQARANLRQALYAIRKALNGDKTAYLVTKGDQISLAGPDMELDVALFEQLVTESTPHALKRAAALYKGDLLDGFSLKEDSFEAWALVEREKLRRLASDALSKLIAHCDEIGDTSRCVETAARLLSLDPLREAAHRILMRAYAAQGRGASALKQFKTCRDILKRELGVEPEPKTVALYHELRQHRATTPEGKTDSGPKPETEGPPLPDGPSVAVLPFRVMSADSDQEFFADGVSEDIITALSKVPYLLVIARNSTFTYKGRAVDVKQVGREQGVRYVLEGSVRKAGSRVRITSQLIDATTGLHIWGESYDRDLNDIFVVQDEITRKVMIALDVRLSGGEQVRLWSSGTNSLEAWQCVRLSADLLNKASPECRSEAQRLIKKALELDPKYAFAWVVMGRAYRHISDMGTAGLGEEENRQTALEAAVECEQKAIELDPTCADAYALLGLCYLSKREYDEAISMSEKAIALAPNHSENLATFAATLNKSGQPEKALELIKRAMRLCPIYPSWYLFVLGTTYRLLGQNETAVSTFKESIKRNAAIFAPHVGLASTLGELGWEKDARKSVTNILRIDPNFSIKKYVRELSYKDPTELLRFEDGLRKVGLPE